MRIGKRNARNAQWAGLQKSQGMKWSYTRTFSILQKHGTQCYPSLDDAGVSLEVGFKEANGET